MLITILVRRPVLGISADAWNIRRCVEHRGAHGESTIFRRARRQPHQPHQQHQHQKPHTNRITSTRSHAPIKPAAPQHHTPTRINHITSTRNHAPIKPATPATPHQRHTSRINSTSTRSHAPIKPAAPATSHINPHQPHLQHQKLRANQAGSPATPRANHLTSAACINASS